MNAVDPARRFSRHAPCPICGGGADLPQHRGVRCYGFLSGDGMYAHCTREEYSGMLVQNETSQTYAHRLDDTCHCGASHGNILRAQSTIEKRGADGSAESEKSSMLAVALGVPSGSEKRNGATPRGALSAEHDYEYRDAEGTLVAIHRRRDFAGGSKTFAWLTADGEISNGQVKPEALPLYGLADLLAAPTSHPVYFTEGEKACDAVRGLGETAVACGGGSGQRSFGEAFAPLRGRRVFLLPDNDARGRAYMERVALALRLAGATPATIELPGIEEHEDVVEWIARGGTADALAGLCLAALERESQANSTEARENRETANGADLESEKSSLPDGTPKATASIEKPTGIRLTPLAQFLAEEDEAARWVVEGLLIHGGSSVLVAKPKAGKSTLARALLAALVRGDSFLDRPTTPGPAVYLAIEEKRSELRRQLVELGLSTEPVYIHTGSIDEKAAPAIDQLAQAIEQTGAQLLIIDPLYKFVRIKDGNDYAEVSRVLEPITDLGRRSGCHICIVHHATKAGEGQDAILGSTALAAAVDTMLLLKRDGQVRTLRSTQRYGDDLEEIVLAKDDRGQIGVSGSAFDQAVANTETRVLEAVTEGAFTETQILARVTGDTNLIRFALRRLVTDGFVQKRGQGKRGSPYEYFPRTEGE